MWICGHKAQRSKLRYVTSPAAMSLSSPSQILDYYKWFGWIEISVFSKRLQIQTRNNLETVRKVIEFSLAALIPAYQPRVALRSLSKENSVSSAKGLDRTSRAHSVAPRSPDLTPRDSYLWGYLNDQDYLPPMALSLRERISQAIASVDESQLRLTWEDVDTCRVTNETHIEHL
jgi:hypothetical protein